MAWNRSLIHGIPTIWDIDGHFSTLRIDGDHNWCACKNVRESRSIDVDCFQISPKLLSTEKLTSSGFLVRNPVQVSKLLHESKFGILIIYIYNNNILCMVKSQFVYYANYKLINLTLSALVRNMLIFMTVIKP